jgi:putative protease
MCTSVSGRCYLSSDLISSDPNFSANRGSCVQPCRRVYRFIGEEGEEIEYEPKSGMFFNAKDLCMIEHIDRLMQANISAFKIEGRMRDPLYISETASCYREAINSVLEGTYTELKIKQWLIRLSKVYNRGFHTGFYFQTPSINEIEFNVRGNISKIKREHVGRVLSYDKKDSIVKAEIYKGSIRKGDHMIFENNSDFFHAQNVDQIFLNNAMIKSSPEANPYKHIIIGLKTGVVIPRNCKIYVLRDSST